MVWIDKWIDNEKRKIRIQKEINSIFKSNPDIQDHRKQYPWVTGFLGNLDSNVMFVAENPSLTKVIEASKALSDKDSECQWNISKGDKIFRKTLKKYRFKESNAEEKGGWKCYITNVAKVAYKPYEWAKMKDETRFQIIKKFAPILEKEMSMMPMLRVIAVMGVTRLREIFIKLLKENLIASPERVKIEYIWHYAYFNRGGTNIEKYERYFLRIKDLIYS